MSTNFRKVLDVQLPESIAPEYLDGEITFKEFFKQVLLQVWDTKDPRINEILGISNPDWKTYLKYELIMRGKASCQPGYAHTYVSDLIAEIFDEEEK